MKSYGMWDGNVYYWRADNSYGVCPWRNGYSWIHQKNKTWSYEDTDIVTRVPDTCVLLVTGGLP